MTEKVLSAADIMAAQDLRRVALSVPEWGGTVYVREMACEEMDLFSPIAARFREASFTLADMCRICALTLCDADGNRLFSNEQMDALGHKNSKPIQAVFLKALEISGMTKAAVDGEKKD